MTRSPAEGDTIVALSSGRPPAAIAVIRSSGPNAFRCLEKLSAKAAPEPRVATLRRLLDPASGETIDDALVLCFPAPASATGEDIVEYQCHGGAAVVDRLLSCLTALPDVRLAEPGEFTRRAFVNGRIDLTEAEGLADLLEAETEAQRKAALLVAEGGIRRTVEDWRTRLVDLSARAEAAIDYVGDEDETAVDVAELRSSAGSLAAELQEWLTRPRAELLKGGIRVVAAGPPNAGKSSLINALAGVDKAIVTDIAGTTRDVIEVPVAMDGLPLVLVDTAGVRESDDPVERIGVARAQAELARADILLWLGEPDDAPSSAIPVHARCDMAGRGEAPLSSIAVAAPSGVGLGELWSAILQRAEPLVPAEGQVALNRRQAGCISDAEIALAAAAADEDLVILAHQLAEARRAFERLTGRSGVEDMLEALFSRFCLGK